MTRVVVAHDYLTQRGGAERVVVALLSVFPGARVVTSVYVPETTFPELRDVEVETILPDWTPLVRRDARAAFPLLAPAFGRHRIRDADVVVCSSSGWAHGVGADAPKVVYCHTPARWLYAADDYLLGHALPVRLVARAAQAPLRSWDQAAAASAAVYAANSTTVRERIRRVYGREAELVHPPVTVDVSGAQRPADVGGEPFLLTVARGRGYKNGALVEDAAARAGLRLVVVGAEGASTSPHVVHAGRVDDDRLRWLYASCRGLVAAAHEDFGLTPIEAMSFGKPVLALRAGGYLDSVVDGVTGSFFDRADVDTLAAALAAFDEARYDPAAIRDHAATFGLDRFAERMRALVEAAA